MKTIKSKTFVPLISKEKLNSKVQEIAQQINKKYYNEEVVILGVLNGSFMFLSDLCKELKIENRITFIKVSSYINQHSSGKVKEVIGIEHELKNKNILIVEDVIDTGVTMDWLTNHLAQYQPKQIEVCTLLIKPNSLTKSIKVHYSGFEIGDEFVIGYGLDFDGYGRDLPEIYVTHDQ